MECLDRKHYRTRARHKNTIKYMKISSDRFIAMKRETSEQTPWQRLNVLYSIHGSRQGTKAVAKLLGIGKIVTEQK